MNVFRGRAIAIVAGGLLAATAVAAGGTSASAAQNYALCPTSWLSAEQTDSGAGMSQPYSYITVTNTSSAPCRLNGYPRIGAAWTRAGRVPITVSHGSINGAQDAGPKRIVLEPGDMAWFAMGTATAYDPPVRNLTQVAVAVTAGTSVSQSLKVTVNQQASAPKGGPIPVTVTAWAAGEGTAS